MGVRDLLSAPWMFETYQSLIGAPKCHKRYVHDYVRPNRGDRIIDLGCGLGVALDHLAPDTDYLGVDIHEPYIKVARKRHPGRQFIVGDLESMDLAPFGTFDIAISFGVVHHLTDQVASAFARQAKAVTKPGGRLVTLDPVYLPKMPKVARFLIDHDRGSFPRDEGAYRNIFQGWGTVDTAIVTDMLRVPYTMIITTVVFDS